MFEGMVPFDGFRPLAAFQIWVLKDEMVLEFQWRFVALKNYTGVLVLMMFGGVVGCSIGM